MLVFQTLLLKLIPLYCIIGLGYISGKYLRVAKESIAPLLIYIIAPAVVFYAIIQTDLNISLISLPLLLFTIAVIIASIFTWFTPYIWPRDKTAAILNYSAGTGNTGYFGLPVIASILGNEMLGITVLATLGLIIYENTYGYFLVARGQYSFRESVIKVLAVPTVYAATLAIVLNALQFSLSSSLVAIFEQFKGSYTILGMMIIGLGLSQATRQAWDTKFISLSFLAKFIIWPGVILMILTIDTLYLNFYSSAIHQVLTILACVPLAANTVVVASQLKAQPEKAAVAVLISTLFALFIIPLVAIFYTN